MDRRRLQRNQYDTRVSLERALTSWLRLRDAWELIFDGARAMRNAERMALAEAKLTECQDHIRRIRGELDLQPA